MSGYAGADFLDLYCAFWHFLLHHGNLFFLIQHLLPHLLHFFLEGLDEFQFFWNLNIKLSSLDVGLDVHNFVFPVAKDVLIGLLLQYFHRFAAKVQLFMDERLLFELELPLDELREFHTVV